MELEATKRHSQESRSASSVAYKGGDSPDAHVLGANTAASKDHATNDETLTSNQWCTQSSVGARV